MPMRFFRPGLIVGLFLGASVAQAACVDFVRPPLVFERSNWQELELFVSSSTLNPAIEQVQRLNEDGQGMLNIDQYSITIDADGQSAGELFRDIRSDLGEIIFGSSNAANLFPFSAEDRTKWASDNPKGAVMVFRLETLGFGLIPLERGAVVVSCLSETDFVFSTVRVGSSVWPDGPGWHPVSGNRGFGVRDNGNGSLTFFVKAADRVADAAFFENIVGNDTIFSGGHAVWLGMLNNVAARYATRNPRDRVAFSERVQY